MLTGPLLITRFRNGKVFPHQLPTNPSNLKLSSELIGLFKQSSGQRRCEIEEQVRGCNLEKVNPKVIQGLSQILFNRCCFSHASQEDPQEIREKVFSTSAEYWKGEVSELSDFTKHKKEILDQLHINSEEKVNHTESWLFGDISGNQRLNSFEELTPQKLIHRFNIEQVQGILLHVVRLELKIDRQHDVAFRQVMQMMKFFRLMFEVTHQDKDWISFRIDGPGSVLENRRSYGLEIAQFFPAVLLLSSSWYLAADLKIPHRTRQFLLEISHDNPYQTFYTTKRFWLNQKITDLVARFNEKFAESWQADMQQTILSLKNNRYLLPDFLIKTVVKTGKMDEFMVEWVQYLSDSKIQRMKQILPELPSNYIFAVKGKKGKLKNLVDTLGDHLLLFSKELTAPALKKKIDEWQ